MSDEVVKAIARKQQPNRNVVYDRLREMLDVCCQEYKVDPVQGENIWFSCLERVFKHIKIENLVKENIPLAIRELLNDIVSLVLEKLCEEVNVDFFINVPRLLLSDSPRAFRCCRSMCSVRPTS